MNQILTRYLLTLALILLVFSKGVLAEDLNAAWRVALGSDQSIQATLSRVASAKAELEAAKAARLPDVSASAGITQFDDAPAFDFSGAGVTAILPLFDGESMQMADARITLPLYTGGMVLHGIDAAEAMLEAQQFQSGASTQQIKLAVAEQYINVLRAKSALAVADSNVKSLSAHVRDVDNMFKSGAVARNDYLAAAVSLADSEQRRLQARNHLDFASAAYNRALGRDLGTPVSLDEYLPDIDPILDLTSLEALTEIALRSRAELGGLDSAAEALRYQADYTRAQTRPHLAVTGGYMALQNEFLNRDEFWMVGVGVQWNVFDGGQARKKASALSFKSNAVRQERNNLRSHIELQVRQAWLRLNETRERKRFTARAVEQADENLRVVRDRYRNGEGTNTEVLDAERLRSLSRSNHDNADFDAKLALYELARGVGRL
ncbi:MAG: TolC family protein [Gammaproteobacteria bacterium]|nr:TolC family protein [Gammaproteobacteria bacterium]NNL52165.1 TolC family protein [Woeseiaceae bacterium]